MQPPPRVWALLGPHRGDNNQVLALAEALGWPFEEKRLRYNALRRIPPAILGPTFRSVEADCRTQLEGELPDLTISTGLRSVPAVRELRRRSPKIRAVHLGFPRISPRHFDLVVPTPEYPIPDARNVLRIPFALTPHTQREVAQADLEQLRCLPSPRRLLLLGGPTLYWELPRGEILGALRYLLEEAVTRGGSVVAVGSPRTPPDLLAAVANGLQSSSVPHLLAPGEAPPSYPALIETADELYVTADSVAMTADAVMTGRPVGLIPIAKSRLGRVVMQITDRLRPGERLYPRDLRFFWAALKEQGIAGTLEQPMATNTPDYAQLVADRVRQLLAQPPQQATNDRDNAR
jgi:mitochondrial fission protein ELM1